MEGIECRETEITFLAIFVTQEQLSKDSRTVEGIAFHLILHGRGKQQLQVQLHRKKTTGTHTHNSPI